MVDESQKPSIGRCLAPDDVWQRGQGVVRGGRRRAPVAIVPDGPTASKIPPSLTKRHICDRSPTTFGGRTHARSGLV